MTPTCTYVYKMDDVLQCVILLFLSYQYEASRAVTSVFVQKGSDVQMDVQEDVPEDFLFFTWKFNVTDNLVSFSHGGKPRVSNLYTGRVEVLEADYTVKLKNVRETDSGVYTAVFIGDNDQTAAIYKVTVQARVSPVNLTVDPVFNSSDSCNLTVTCRTQDSHIRTTFTCVNQICSKDGDRSKATTSDAVLHVYLENGSITCNHSNQVSWITNQGAKIQDFCHQQAKESQSHVAAFVVVPVVIITGLIIAAVLLCYMKNRKKKIFSVENTVYAVPDVPTGQTQQRFLVSDDSNLSPASTYCLVGSHAGSSRSETSNALPQSVYAEVEGPVTYHH